MLMLAPVATNHLALDTIQHCDVFTYLRALPAESVNCVVTSPPYWNLRDYGVSGQIGTEPTPGIFVERMRLIFREVYRVLRSDGTLWLNLGDSYANDTKWGGVTSGKHASGLQGTTFIGRNRTNTGLPSKSLIGIPWRVAFALQDDGWILRSDIVWNKPNAMPESVSDRPTKAHEYIFLLSKSPKYFYDAKAIREPAIDGDPRSPRGSKGNTRLNSGNRKQDELGKRTYTGFNDRWDNRAEPLEMRNKRSVWNIPTESNPYAHFATFPQKLIEPMILAGCPEGGIVLDPFMGSGTTARVAKRLGRHYIGCDLNPEYVALARNLIKEQFAAPLLDLIPQQAQVQMQF